ncbi:hypothetical protein [Deinococcus planocerae]|uniref:hypothetical protein n=1 Tax=Deinococcus planocerae TaxID=1737569 RepID=UPI000C7F672D|nr:hypothetical protein [Deinococcus planocerae]
MTPWRGARPDPPRTSTSGSSGRSPGLSRLGGRFGILIERHGQTFEQAWAAVESGGSELYAWQEGRALYDPQGELARRAARASVLLASYRVSPRERQALRHWLLTTLGKLRGAAPDHALLLVHTTTWKLAEALCAVNGRPVPASTLMWELLPGLPHQLPGSWLEALLSGEAGVRLSTFVGVARWTVEALGDDPG